MLTKHMQTILLALLADARRIEQCTTPPAWDTDLRREFDEYRRFGVRHDLAHWLGHLPTAAESAVFSRTLRDLECRGLVIRVKRWGSLRSTHVRLTERGRAEAERVVEQREAALQQMLDGVEFHLDDVLAEAPERPAAPEDGLDSSAPAR
jgi:hypothetical protein